MFTKPPYPADAPDPAHPHLRRRHPVTVFPPRSGPVTVTPRNDTAAPRSPVAAAPPLPRRGRCLLRSRQDTAAPSVRRRRPAPNCRGRCVPTPPAKLSPIPALSSLRPLLPAPGSLGSPDLARLAVEAPTQHAAHSSAPYASILYVLHPFAARLQSPSGSMGLGEVGLQETTTWCGGAGHPLYPDALHIAKSRCCSLCSRDSSSTASHAPPLPWHASNGH